MVKLGMGLVGPVAFGGVSVSLVHCWVWSCVRVGMRKRFVCRLVFSI